MGYLSGATERYLGCRAETRRGLAREQVSLRANRPHQRSDSAKNGTAGTVAARRQEPEAARTTLQNAKRQADRRSPEALSSIWLDPRLRLAPVSKAHVALRVVLAVHLLAAEGSGYATISG